MSSKFIESLKKGELPEINLPEVWIQWGRLEELAPTPPSEGPPLPKIVDLKWPKPLRKVFPQLLRITISKDLPIIGG